MTLLIFVSRSRTIESGTRFPIKHIHLVLIQTFGATELQPLLTRTKVQILFSVTDVFTPITDTCVVVHLQQKS